MVGHSMARKRDVNVRRAGKSAPSTINAPGPHERGDPGRSAVGWRAMVMHEVCTSNWVFVLDLSGDNGGGVRLADVWSGARAFADRPTNLGVA
jgi:hypothetical protein